MRNFLDYYSRSDIQKAILDSSKDREVAVKLGDIGFGKRPETLNYESDILELAKQGATSFNISEERWKNPQHLVTGMTKKQLDELRIGWDFILDIDSPELEHSKIIAYFLLQAIKFYDIKNVSIKYSGNKGFHIGLPFESFPKTINGTDSKELFPESARIIAEYLSHMVKPYVSEKIKEGDIDKIFNIDSVLISSRHLYRSPYSLHEKSGLVSLPINPEDVLNFNKEQAVPEKVIPKLKFLDKFKENEAEQLLKSAYDWYHEKLIRKKAIENEEIIETKKYSEITEAIPEEFFPKSIKQGLKGLKDGRKRFLFILLNFLKCVGWSHNEITLRVKEWNNSNPEPLHEGYILGQLQWHKRQTEKILPPNYTNDAYYKDLGLDISDFENQRIKNPVNYTIRRFKMTKFKKK